MDKKLPPPGFRVKVTVSFIYTELSVIKNGSKCVVLGTSSVRSNLWVTRTAKEESSRIICILT
jgi:hypothetical protein